jgi:uncharacterized Zn finger protein
MDCKRCADEGVVAPMVTTVSEADAEISYRCGTCGLVIRERELA